MFANGVRVAEGQIVGCAPDAGSTVGSGEDAPARTGSSGVADVDLRPPASLPPPNRALGFFCNNIVAFGRDVCDSN